MFLVSVIPFVKQQLYDELSYISTHSYDVGSVIEVSLRKKKVKALVVRSIEAREEKSQIKLADFNFKKIEKDTKEWKNVFHSTFIKSIEEIASYYLKPVGSILSLFGEQVENKTRLIPENKEQGTVFAIQHTFDERMDVYKSIVREYFAKKQSVLIVVPTRKIEEKVFSKLKKGIENYTVSISNTPNKKLKEFLELDHPTLFIALPQQTHILEHNPRVIIVEEESSRFFQTQTFPYVNWRMIFYILSKHLKINLYLGDTLLRPETHLAISNSEITEYGRLSQKVHHPIETFIVETKKEDSPEKKKSSRNLSKELLEMVHYAINKNKKMFILSPRKGLSPVTYCMDCGKAVLCNKCESLVTLHKKKDEKHNVFICHHCGEFRSALETCKNCGGFRLESYSFGSEKIIEEIEETFKITPFKLDTDEAKTFEKAKKIVDEFRKKGNILVGGPSALVFFDKEEFSFVAIPNCDGFLAISDIRVSLETLSILTKSKLLASEHLLIETKDKTQTVIEATQNGDIMKVLKEELELRKALGFPPFSKFIKISVITQKEKNKDEVSKIMHILNDWHPKLFPALQRNKKGQVIANIIISIPKDKKDQKLEMILQSFPPFIRVKIDPESLL